MHQAEVTKITVRVHVPDSLIGRLQSAIRQLHGFGYSINYYQTPYKWTISGDVESVQLLREWCEQNFK